ncbi:MAG: hypothetical protein E6G41_13840 [Actinobacteria bacterium]|nr:MAG: hypothetical protein E6G41_13840 [Actinomycetota bacterium]
MNEFNIRLSTTAEDLLLIADVDGEPSAAIRFADGQAVGVPADAILMSALRFYRWGLRGITTVWGA